MGPSVFMIIASQRAGADSVLCSSYAYASWNTWNCDVGKGEGLVLSIPTRRTCVCVCPVRKKRKIIRIHSGIILTHRCHIKSDRRRQRRILKRKKIRKETWCKALFCLLGLPVLYMQRFFRSFLFRDHGKYEENVKICTQQWELGLNGRVNISQIEMLRLLATRCRY